MCVCVCVYFCCCLFIHISIFFLCRYIYVYVFFFFFFLPFLLCRAMHALLNLYYVASPAVGLLCRSYWLLVSLSEDLDIKRKKMKKERKKKMNKMCIMLITIEADNIYVLFRIFCCLNNFFVFFFMFVYFFELLFE